MLITALSVLPAFAVDTDGDGVPDNADPEPENIRETGYLPFQLYEINGDSENQRLGFSVSGVGDVNGDGYDDVIAGGIKEGQGLDPDPYPDPYPYPDRGIVSVYSGIDGTLIRSVEKLYRYGFSVNSAGDVNGDGYGDYIVGTVTLEDFNFKGNATVYNGLNGAILLDVDGDDLGDRFGWDVSYAGDVNSDGYDDVIIGAPYDDDGGGNSGSARVYSVVDQKILYSFYGDQEDGTLGLSVSNAGDINADGYDDVVVGARHENSGSGSVRVYSGEDGGILYAFHGTGPNNYFGDGVAGVGDINNDGYDDLIVNNRTDLGEVNVFSGKDGSILYTISDTGVFATAISSAGDVNGNGYPDMIFGSHIMHINGSWSGKAQVYDGKNGDLLYAYIGDSANDELGRSVSSAGDVNNDGYSDLIVGAWKDDNTAENSGSVRVFSGAMFLQYTVDTDIDGLVNTLDLDDDGDGLLDVNDIFPLDTDNDGVENNLDWDDDNDHIPDVVDAEPLNNANSTEIPLPLDGSYKGVDTKISLDY